MKIKFPVSQLLAVLAMLYFSFATVAKEREYSNSVKAEAIVSPQQVYEGECFKYTVELICDNPNIGNIRRLNNATRVDGLSLVTSLDANLRPYTDSKGNYIVEISSEIYACCKSGKIVIPGGRYRIDFMVPTTVYDPFWGYVRTSERVTREVIVPSVTVKCKSLPKAPESFSGAVGNFEFSCENPSVIGSPGSEIQLLYTVEGEGLLGDVKVPDIASNLPSGLKLKSITPYDDAYLRDNTVCSRVRYLCVVTSSETGEYEIPSIAFIYFNPQSKKFVTVNSEQCKVSVGEKKRTTPLPQGQYVLNLTKSYIPPVFIN